jgi:hypothetical protein
MSRCAARNTIIESTFEVGRRVRCTMRVDCGQLDPGAVIWAAPAEWHESGTYTGMPRPGHSGCIRVNAADERWKLRPLEVLPLRVIASERSAAASRWAAAVEFVDDQSALFQIVGSIRPRDSSDQQRQSFSPAPSPWLRR